MKPGDLVIWKINPYFVGIILREAPKSISRKYEIYWLQEKKTIINFEQDLILLSKNNSL